MAIVNTHYGFCAKGGTVPKFTYTGEYNVRDDGVVELLTSGTLMFLDPAVIDIFCVGGGGKGGEVRVGTGIPVGSGEGYSGGGSGYTATRKKYEASGQYIITIGQGSIKNSTTTEEQRGGTTSFGDVLSALGGFSGYVNREGTSGVKAKRSMQGRDGGSGGAGGVTSNADFGAGGSDGGNGENGYYSTTYTPNGGAGQGITTREFGESTGKLYAGGGGSGRYLIGNTPIISAGGSGGGGSGAWGNRKFAKYQAASAGGANTGGGGGGGVCYAKANGETTPFSYLSGAGGGSGIVCFRAAKDQQG